MRIALDRPRTYMDALPRFPTEIIGDSMTRQDQAEMVNINYIYSKTQRSELVLGSPTLPTFGDFSDNGTYDVMLETIMAAEDAFMELPAEIRKQYNHDPVVYYEQTLNDASMTVKEKLAKDAADKKAAADAKKLEKARKLVKDNPEE